MPGQQALSAQNTLRQLVACPGKEENAEEQRTGSRNRGKVTASQAAHCRLDGHKAKNARKVQPHEKPISTQFKEEIRVMDGPNTSDSQIPKGSLRNLPFSGYLQLLYLNLSSSCPAMKETGNSDNSSCPSIFQVKYFHVPNEDFVYIHSLLPYPQNAYQLLAISSR